MLFEAVIDPSRRKIKIAAEKVDLRQLGGFAARRRRTFGLLQYRKRTLNAVNDAHSFGLTDPGIQPLPVVNGGTKRTLKGLDRLVHFADLTQDVAIEACSA